MEFKEQIGPFIKSKNSTPKMMKNLLISLIPIILFSFYYNGIRQYNLGYINLLDMFKPLLIIFLGAIVSFILEVIISFIFLKEKNPIKYSLKSYSFFPGLFLSLIVPVNIPIWLLIFGVIFGVIFGKVIFGGFGKNIFNPALIGYLFIFMCYSTILAQSLDGVSGATPLANLKGYNYIGTYDNLVMPYNSLFSLFLGFKSGALGEISGLLCVVAFIYLSITKVIKAKIPISCCITVFVMTYIIGLINGLGIWYPTFQLLVGGLLFGAVFMATDPVTSPVTSCGQVLYGIFMGIIVVICRFLIPSLVEGVMISILVVNMLSSIFDDIGVKAKFSIIKYVISIAILIIIGITISFYIGNNKKVSESTKSSTIEILDTIKNNKETNYIINSKGYTGKIKLSVTFVNNNINKIEILEHGEQEFINEIENGGLLENIIFNNGNIDNVDGVSGATFTSKYIKDAIKELVKIHNEE